MNGVYLTAAELDALHGCGPLGIAVYVHLRAWMDLRSGTVGVSRPISRAMILAYVETHVPRGAGMETVKPTIKELRTAIDRLSRAGLLRRKGNDDALVFRLPLAQTLSLDQIKQGRVRADSKDPEQGRKQGREQGQQENDSNTSICAGFGYIDNAEQGRVQGGVQAREPGRIKKAIPGLHQRSENKPSTSQAASTGEPVEGPSTDLAATVADLWSAKKIETAQVPEHASRRATAIAVMLRVEQISATAMNPTVIAWAEQGVKDEQLRAAVVLARQRREAEGSLQPINVGYLNACLQSILKPPKPKAEAWWQSVATMEAKARELGIPGARPGEELDSFKARIQAAVRCVEATAG